MLGSLKIKKKSMIVLVINIYLIEGADTRAISMARITLTGCAGVIINICLMKNKFNSAT